MHFLAILTGSLAVVAASPFPEPTGDVQKRAAARNCKDDATYKTLSAQGAKGTDFCYEYLHLSSTTTEVTGPKKTITVTVPKTTSYYSCKLAREAEAEPEPEPEAQPEEGDAPVKRQLLSAVAALAADKISKGCECFGLTTKTVTKTNYPITISTKTSGTAKLCRPTKS